MAYNKNAHHGYADQNSFWEMPITDIAALTGAEESTQVAGVGENRRFAHLMYQVNPVPINLSGDVIIDTDALEAINADGFDTLSGQLDNLETINADGFSTLSGQLDNLETINADGFSTLSGQFDTGLKDIALALFIEASGDFTWVAESLPGTTQGSALWRVKRLQDTTTGGTQTITTLWADGNGNFDNVATSPLSGLTYS